MATRSTSSKSGVIAAVVGGVIVAVVVVGVVVLVWSSVARSRTSRQDGGTASYRSAWESAMKKAGVEATLPPLPTALNRYEAEGVHDFDATFTAEEATALMNVYTYEADISGATVTIRRPRIEFPAQDTLRVAGFVSSGTQGAQATIEAPITYTLTTRIRAAGQPTIEAEGFRVTGAQADQAVDAALSYGNGYLAAGPGLIPIKATITPDGVRVEGRAPDKLVRKSDSGQ